MINMIDFTNLELSSRNMQYGTVCNFASKNMSET